MARGDDEIISAEGEVAAREIVRPEATMCKSSNARLMSSKLARGSH